MGVIAVARRGEPARQARAASSSAAASRCPKRTRSLHADGRARDPQRHGRHARRAGGPPRAAPRWPCPRSRRSAPAGAEVPIAVEVDAARPGRVQRHRRLHPRRPRIRHHDHRRIADAGAVGQRARQPVVRHRRQRERRRLHVVRERPRVTASRPGTTTRSATPAARRSTSATRRPAGSGRPRRCRPAGRCRTSTRHGFGYSIFEYTEDGIVDRDVDLRRDRRAGEVRRRSSCATAPARPRRLSVTGLFELVLGDAAAGKRCRTSSPRSTPRPARCSPATRTTASSATASRSSTAARRSGP